MVVLQGAQGCCSRLVHLLSVRREGRVELGIVVGLHFLGEALLGFQEAQKLDGTHGGNVLRERVKGDFHGGDEREVVGVPVLGRRVRSCEGPGLRH